MYYSYYLSDTKVVEQIIKGISRMNQKGYRDQEYKEIKKTIQQQGNFSIINNELIEKVARYKFYYCLWNANNRVRIREEYKNCQYLLGEYTKGFDYIKVHKELLYEKLLKIIENYLLNYMNENFAPQIHREMEHYSWDTIDILTAKEHKEIDTKNSKATIVRGQLTNNKLIQKNESKSLTVELLKKIAGGKQFPSKKKANEYIQNEYGIKGSIDKFIDTAETINTDKGSF